MGVWTICLCNALTSYFLISTWNLDFKFAYPIYIFTCSYCKSCFQINNCENKNGYLCNRFCLNLLQFRCIIMIKLILDRNLSNAACWIGKIKIIKEHTVSDMNMNLVKLFQICLFIPMLYIIIKKNECLCVFQK